MGGWFSKQSIEEEGEEENDNLLNNTIPENDCDRTDLFPPIDIGDLCRVKNMIDETICSTILEHEHAYIEDLKSENVKLVIMAFACTFALFGQISNADTLEDYYRPVLLTCIIMYFTLSGSIQYLITCVDQDTIMTLLPNEHSKDILSGMRVRSNLMPAQDRYEICLQVNTGKTGFEGKYTCKDFSVGEYFTKEGYFWDEGIKILTLELLEKFEKGIYDKEKDNEVKKEKKKKEKGSKSD